MLACACVLSGCNLAGAIIGKTVGQPDVEPKYVFDKTQPLLVIAENYRDPSPSAFDAERLARLVGEDLSLHEVAPVVSFDKVSALRDRGPAAFAKMSVVEVAERVGAQQVLYVDLDAVGVGVQSGSDILKGTASARVTVIDVASGRVVYPGGLSEGLPVGFDSPMRRAGDDATPDTVRRETLVGLGGRIARLFYKWKPSDVETMEMDI